ncbi:probable transcription factor At5g61620 [Rhodamnia argentea]|uniref:Probable transcription factor At5g61620 n=1 Tax=Rhodamnia argentea TaxID=178133 RepID=A0ABM3HMA1_9MYRT|nr:probable transcription factor At5g61620 [Rhodamnia argentea]
MVKEATPCGGRKCSHCGHNGHNARTCNGKGCVKLFGVYVSENSRASMKKSSSAENMRSPSCNKSSELAGVDLLGYLSDDPNHHSPEAKAARERKKGKPWTMEEHVTFLEGLKKLGKGDWRGISKNFVPTRTPTQVASHAQKYFLRQVINDKKKRRTSMFDLHSQDHDHDDASPDSPVMRPNVATEAPTSHSQACLSELIRTCFVLDFHCSRLTVLSLLFQAVTSSKSLDVAAQKQNALQVVEQFPALCLDNPPVGPCPRTVDVGYWFPRAAVLGIPLEARRAQ